MKKLVECELICTEDFKPALKILLNLEMAKDQNLENWEIMHAIAQAIRDQGDVDGSIYDYQDKYKG